MMVFKKEMITQMVVFWTIDISENYYKVIAIDLGKQQALDADPNQYNKLMLLEI